MWSKTQQVSLFPRDAPARHRVPQEDVAAGHQTVELLALSPESAEQKHGSLDPACAEVGHHLGDPALRHRDHDEVVARVSPVVNGVLVLGQRAFRVTPAIEDLDLERAD